MPRRRGADPGTANLDRAFEWVWTITVLAIPLVYVGESLSPFLHPKLLVLQVGLLLMCILWGLRTQALSRPALPRSPLILPVLLFLALSSLSVLQAVNRCEAVIQLSHRFTAVLFALAVLCNARSDRVLRLLRPVVLGCGVIAVVGVTQYAGLGFLSIPTFGLPSATLGYRNYAAMFLISCIPLAFYLLTRARTPVERVVWSCALLLMLVLLVCTRSRGAWLGLCGGSLAVGVAVLIAKRKGLTPMQHTRSAGVILAACVVVAVGFSAVVPPRMGEKGLTTHSPEKSGLTESVESALEAGADKGRWAMWSNTVDMVLDHPLLGVGIGNWQFEYPPYDRGNVVWKGATPRRPHNDYLWRAAQIGLPGLFAFLWIVWVGLGSAARSAILARDSSGFWLPACLGAAVLGVLVHACFSFPSERIPSSTVFWGLLALLALPNIRWPRSEGREARSRIPLLSSIVTAACIWITLSAISFYRHYATAEAALARGRWQTAVAEATAALGYGIHDPQIYLQRGLAHYALGDYDAAVRDNDRCLQFHPHLANALNNAGMALNGAGNYARSLEVLDRLRDLVPGHVEVHANRGIALEGLDRPEEAVASYERYLAARPDNAGIQHRLGAAHLKMGQTDSAMAGFRRALALNPAHLPAQVALGELLAESGDTAAAVASYRTFLRSGRGAADAADLIRRRLNELLDRGREIGKETR